MPAADTRPCCERYCLVPVGPSSSLKSSLSVHDSMVSPQKPTERLEGADEGGDGSRPKAAGECTVASVPKIANECAAHSVSAVPDGESARSVSVSTNDCILVSVAKLAGKEEVASNSVPKGPADVSTENSNPKALVGGTAATCQETVDLTAEREVTETAGVVTVSSCPEPADELAENSVLRAADEGSAALVPKKTRNRKPPNKTRPIPSMGPQECHVCHKILCNKAVLRQHFRTHTGERPFSCDFCPMKFTTHYGLVVHRRLHTGEKPYVCEVCDRRFSQWASRQSHMATHSAEKPHKCPVCEKGFARRDTLQIHLGTHTGERPYCCSVCPKTYRYRDTLQRHEQKKHKPAS